MNGIYAMIAEAESHAGIIMALLSAADETENDEYISAYVTCCLEHIAPLQNALEGIVKEVTAE